MAKQIEEGVKLPEGVTPEMVEEWKQKYGADTLLSKEITP